VRSVVDFYRARPLVGIIVFCVGLAIAVATVSLQKGDGIVLPVAFTALMGVVVGGVVGLGRRGREERFDFEAAEADEPVEPPRGS
jgi:NhaP-type Na+/H+ or K+/H+ antiporter